MDASELLNQRIGRFSAPSSSVSVCADELRRPGFKVCSMEDLAAGEATRPIRREGATLGELLDEITRRNPGYVWTTERADLINIYPAESVLDEIVGPLSVVDKDFYRVLGEDLELGKRGVSLFMGLTAGDGPPVSLRFESASLRDALNEIVAQLRDAVWHISGRRGAYSLTISVVGP